MIAASTGGTPTPQRGTVVGLYIASEAAQLPHAQTHVQATAGRGLQGDRYFLQRGTFWKPDLPDRQLTLISIEAIDAVAQETGRPITPAQMRRNVVTKGIDLNTLVGKTFRIGNAVAHGIKLCEPCGHLEQLTKPGVMQAFSGRGGLRAEIVQSGHIETGALLEVL